MVLSSVEVLVRHGRIRAVTPVKLAERSDALNVLKAF
jgi:purine nucleoside phosphorylase